MKTVLVVDDDDLLIEIVCALLAREGYDVRSATTVSEARALFNGDETFSIGLFDYEIGQEATGMTLALEFRQVHPDARAIIISGHRQGYVTKNEDADGIAFLRKPFSPTELLAQMATDSSEPNPPISAPC